MEIEEGKKKKYSEEKKLRQTHVCENQPTLN